MIVYLKGKKLNLNPSKSIGKGGEADIFDIGSDQVLKVFKQPNHPDFTGFALEQQVAQIRLDEHQKKLPTFPKYLPRRVISPIDLATNKFGSRILGYSMRFLKGYEVLLRYADRKYRQVGISNDLVVKTFVDLHTTVKGIHDKNIVIGDFNDLNIMVKGGEAYIIDADSFQFGPFTCKVFTEKFVDPILCNPGNTRPVLVKLHNADSDWYSFVIMLMQSLLFVGPYGGIYKPSDKTKRINHATRPLKRITIFDKEVKYPKPATHFSVLPDDLLQHFHRVFKEDLRGEFPANLLNSIRWTKCSNCGVTYARRSCPGCTQYSPTAVIETVRGNVTCTRVFQTSGMIVFATMQSDRLRYLYHEHGEFKREGGLPVVKGNVRPTMRFRIQGRSTLVGEKGQVVVLSPGNKEKFAADSIGSLSLFEANDKRYYWIDDGRLMRSGNLGPKYIGDVLADQTLFWVGSQFGFGFYRAGNFNVGFVFDSETGSINDSVKLPVMPGQLIDATCYFAGNWAWFIVSCRNRGKTINKCIIIKSNGSVNESAEVNDGDGSWLGSVRGKCAAGKFLLAATDDGIVRIEPDGGTLSIVKKFPDTEPFVDSGCHLFADKSGLFVISRREIKSLKII
jgi:H/ACA ribonucleoprotein complex subunit 3